MYKTMEHCRLHRKRPRERAGRKLLLLTSFLVGEACAATAFLTNPSGAASAATRATLAKNTCKHTSTRRTHVFADRNLNDEDDAKRSDKTKGLEPIVEKLLSPFAMILARIGTSEEEELRRDIAAAEARLKVKKAEMERMESQGRLLGAGVAATLGAVALLSFVDSTMSAPTERGAMARGDSGTTTKKGVFRMDKKTNSRDKSSQFSAPVSAIISGAIGVVGANILLRSKVSSEAQPELDEVLAISNIDSDASSNNFIPTASNLASDNKSREITDLSLEIDDIFSTMEKLQAEACDDEENKNARERGK